MQEELNEVAGFINLTERERQVMLMLCAGMSNKHIAKELKISQKTVDTHRGHVLKKTRSANNVILVLAAIRAGVVTVPRVTVGCGGTTTPDGNGDSVLPQGVEAQS